MTTINPEMIILVHGVGLWGAEMFLLRSRLQKIGDICNQFYYSAWQNSLSENAESLKKSSSRYMDLASTLIMG